MWERYVANKIIPGSAGISSAYESLWGQIAKWKKHLF